MQKGRLFYIITLSGGGLDWQDQHKMFCAQFSANLSWCFAASSIQTGATVFIPIFKLFIYLEMKSFGATRIKNYAGSSQPLTRRPASFFNAHLCRQAFVRPGYQMSTLSESDLFLLHRREPLPQPWRIQLGTRQRSCSVAPRRVKSPPTRFDVDRRFRGGRRTLC